MSKYIIHKGQKYVRVDALSATRLETNGKIRDAINTLFKPSEDFANRALHLRNAIKNIDKLSSKISDDESNNQKVIKEVEKILSMVKNYLKK